MHQTTASQLARPALSAETLNGDCHSALVDRAALQRAMQAQGAEWHDLVTERCPHLFAGVPVFITAAQMIQMREIIEVVERVVGLPGWMQGAGDNSSTSNETPTYPVIDRTTSHSTKPASGQVAGYPAQAGIQSKNNAFVEILDSGLRRNDKRNEVRHSAKGVFYGYDFHLNADGAHLIEINTNAGGGFLNALLIDSQRDAGQLGEAVAIENLEQDFLDMFRNEWLLARGDAPLNTVAIVDEQPESQYLYPEFLLAQRMFERAGIAAYIADPAALHSRDDRLYLESSGEGRKIDMVYNRLTDFPLQQHPSLRQAYQDGSTVVTPCPAHYARYADKRNLARLTDAAGLRALGASEADIVTLQAGIPHTIAVKADMEETLWQERKQWFFKPNTGYGSKGAYRGEKLTKRVFAEILHGEYVAQKLAPPGERSVCVNDAEPVSLKYDVRCYVYDGQVQLVAARLYQGQTTNFRTLGGGFALVRVVE